MIDIILLTKEEAIEVMMLSSGKLNVLTPIELNSGNFFLLKEVLQDQIYSYAYEFLSSLPFSSIDPSEIKNKDIPF